MAQWKTAHLTGVWSITAIDNPPLFRAVSPALVTGWSQAHRQVATKPKLSNTYALSGCWKSPSMDFFNHGSRKRGFPLPSFSMAYSHQKWWHIHVPRTGCRKTVFFNTLLKSIKLFYYSPICHLKYHQKRLKRCEKFNECWGGRKLPVWCRMLNSHCGDIVINYLEINMRIFLIVVIGIILVSAIGLHVAKFIAEIRAVRAGIKSLRPKWRPMSGVNGSHCINVKTGENASNSVVFHSKILLIL